MSDLQMIYLIKKHNMLSILPIINMVTNIGFDLQVSNTIVNPDHPITLRFFNKPKFEIEKIIYPSSIEVNYKFEINEMFKEICLSNKSIWKAKFFFH